MVKLIEEKTGKEKGSIILPKRTKTGKVKKSKKAVLSAEVGLITLIKDKALIEGVRKYTYDALEDRVLSSFYRYCVVNGTKPIKAYNYVQRDEAARGYEYVATMDVVDDKSISATLLKVNEENDRLTTALLDVNKLSWFQLLKGKIKRRKIVDVGYHLVKTIMDA